MGEEIQEWQHLWGAKVKMPIDVPDDILKYGIQIVASKLKVSRMILYNISVSDSNLQLTYGHINKVNVVIQKPIEIRVWLC